MTDIYYISHIHGAYTITWVPSGFSGYIWLDTKILLKTYYIGYTLLSLLICTSLYMCCSEAYYTHLLKEEQSQLNTIIIIVTIFFNEVIRQTITRRMQRILIILAILSIWTRMGVAGYQPPTNHKLLRHFVGRTKVGLSGRCAKKFPDRFSRIHEAQERRGHHARADSSFPVPIFRQLLLAYDRQVQGRHFNFFLGGANFVLFFKATGLLKNLKNSTLYVVISRYS